MILPCRLLYATAIIITILLTGCASQAPSASATVPTAVIVAQSDNAIVPGERIGPLRLAGQVDELVKRFGPGTLRDFSKEGISRLQTWDAIGLWVDFDPGTGNILTISVNYRGPWAEYSTPEGVRLGALKEEVVSVMGRPERTVTGGGLTSFYYDRRGIRLTLIDTGPLAGKVESIRVVWQSVLRGDNLIIPGSRISGVEVGMPIDRILALLGGGYQRAESSPGSHLYLWRHLGLSLAENRGRVMMANASPEGPSDTTELRYSTADGLGYESTARQIKEKFGEPPQTGASPFGGYIWTYRSHGIAFMLDKERKVRLVSVFSPEKQ